MLGNKAQPKNNLDGDVESDGESDGQTRLTTVHQLTGNKNRSTRLSVDVEAHEQRPMDHRRRPRMRQEPKAAGTYTTEYNCWVPRAAGELKRPGTEKSVSHQQDQQPSQRHDRASTAERQSRE